MFKLFRFDCNLNVTCRISCSAVFYLRVEHHDPVAYRNDPPELREILEEPECECKGRAAVLRIRIVYTDDHMGHRLCIDLSCDDVSDEFYIDLFNASGHTHHVRKGVGRAACALDSLNDIPVFFSYPYDAYRRVWIKPDLDIFF